MVVGEARGEIDAAEGGPARRPPGGSGSSDPFADSCDRLRTPPAGRAGPIEGDGLMYAADGPLMLTVCEKDGFRELKRRLACKECRVWMRNNTSQAQSVTTSLMRLGGLSSPDRADSSLGHYHNRTARRPEKDGGS